MKSGQRMKFGNEKSGTSHKSKKNKKKIEENCEILTIFLKLDWLCGGRLYGVVT